MIPIILVIFGDMDSAANAALTVALDCPRQYECGGVIYEDSGHHYHVSAPLTSTSTSGWSFRNTLKVYPRTAGGSWRTITRTSALSTTVCSPTSSLPLTRL